MEEPGDNKRKREKREILRRKVVPQGRKTRGKDVREGQRGAENERRSNNPARRARKKESLGAKSVEKK